MKIAVTAASGRLGHALLRALLQETQARHLVAVARSPEKVTVPGIETRRADYESRAAMAGALAGVDTVVMISAPVAGTDRVALHRNVIGAAREAGVRRLIYTSVIGGGREEETWFRDTQRVNRQTEEDLKASGLRWIVARNGLYLEMDLRHIVAAQATGVYRNIAGDGRCGYISIDELAFALARLALDDRHDGRTLNLVGESLTQARLVDLANEVFGTTVRYQVITDEENVEQLMRDEKIATRGRDVARMLTGCFQCVRNGSFDVPSHFEQAAGRPVKATRAMMQELRRLWDGAPSATGNVR